MQRPIITVPVELMVVSEVNWDIDWRGQSFGETNTGITQVVYNAFPRWVGKPKLYLKTHLIGRWRALRWQAQGRVGIYRVPMNDPEMFRRSNITVAESFVQTGVPFSNGQVFNSGYGFAFEPFVVAAQAAVAGATSLVVDVPDAEYMPVVGQIMSHRDWPFAVVAVTPLTGTEVQLGIQMPLRVAIGSGDPIALQGVGLFEALEDTGGNPEYDMKRVSRPTFALREVLNR